MEWKKSSIPCLPLYRGSGLKCIRKYSSHPTAPVFLCIEEVDWNGIKSVVVTKAVAVFLCIEEVDWNTWFVLCLRRHGLVFLCIEEVDWNRHYIHRGICNTDVFLCIEEVDWNVCNDWKSLEQQVFLCLEEVDWNFVKPNLMQMYSRSSSVYRKCI